ncbi:mitochondrial transcription rescue factor 1 [Homalodisca vitripennis]|uniref:mitochondrial transcription rescue factor 1 n=1 Tax=Homalodisca vitripennis TaxID=197043 RepID=UPI001EEC6867|nr:mitochondrial transcription rescue factor 1 [Homalodisca vitripennis]
MFRKLLTNCNFTKITEVNQRSSILWFTRTDYKNFGHKPMCVTDSGILGFNNGVKLNNHSRIPLDSCKFIHTFFNISDIQVVCLPKWIVSNLNDTSLVSQQRRYKSTKKSKKRPEYDSDSDSDVEEEVSQVGKVVTVRMQSLRLDGLMKKALNVARNKIETAFYQGNIRVNGKKPNKKSFQLKIGDEVDLIRGVSPMNPEYLSVSRVEVISVKEEGDEDEEDQLAIRLRVSKTMYIENYSDDPWKKTSMAE